MEKKEISKKTPETIENQNNNPGREKIERTTEKDNVFDLSNINQEIIKKEKDIQNTRSRIDEIRNSLGLSFSDEVLPSILGTQTSIDKLNQEKAGLENFNFTIVEPIPEETSEEYVSRAMKNIIDGHEEKDSNSHNLPPQLKVSRTYYGKRAHISVKDFFSNTENSIKIRDELLKLENNNDIKFSKNKNSDILNKLSNAIWNANRELARGNTDEKMEYYSNTNQTRDFFSFERKNDAYSYSSMMFGLPESFTNTEEGREYIHHKIDNKNIFLFGGGDSIKDLLKSDNFKPKKVINFDPFIKQESVDKNPNGIYQSQMISASDKRVREMVDRNEVPKADEVWATYSVPFYLDSSEETKELITNMSSVLSEGGNARISPIAIQPTSKEGESFETRRLTLINSIKNLLDSPDYNVSIFNDTIKIHKIKKTK